MAFLVAGCAEQRADLDAELRAVPGVVVVRSAQNDGDNDIPGVVVPRHVFVVMAADATPAQVLRLFDAAGDQVDDEAISGIEVALQQRPRFVLATGAGVHADAALVRELFEALADRRVTAWRRQASPVLPSVEISVRNASFGDLVAEANAHADQGLEYVVVRSGRLILERDGSHPERAEARERFALRLSEQVRVLGVATFDRGPLQITVRPVDEPRARAFLARHGGPLLGKVNLSTKPGSAGSG